MIRVRNIGLILLALLAVGVLFSTATATSYDRDIDSALADDVLNNARTEGAPQQQVVNGWVAKELLTVIARQGEQDRTDERVPGLLTIAILAGVWTVLLTPGRQDAPPPPVVEIAGFPHVPAPSAPTPVS